MFRRRWRPGVAAHRRRPGTTCLPRGAPSETRTGLRLTPVPRHLPMTHPRQTQRSQLWWRTKVRRSRSTASSAPVTKSTEQQRQARIRRWKNSQSASSAHRQARRGSVPPIGAEITSAITRPHRRRIQRSNLRVDAQGTNRWSYHRSRLASAANHLGGSDRRDGDDPEDRRCGTRLVWSRV